MLIAVIAAVSISFAVPASAKENEKIAGQKEYEIVYVTADWLNIRQTAGTEIEPVDCVEHGTELYVIGIDAFKENWSIIWYNDEYRYVCNEYITTEKEEIKNSTLSKKEEKVSNEYLGSYRITHYCNCSTCCGKWAGGGTASGTMPTANRTIATGSEFAFGTQLMINGIVYTVEDRGVGNGCIDIYCDSHSEALSRGMYYTDVYIIR